MKAAIVVAVVMAGAVWMESARSSKLRPSLDLVHLACVGSPPMAVLADEALIRRVNAGDLSALETLYRTYESVVFSLARRLCGSDAEADDVLQDTFVEVGRSLGRYRGEGALSSWLKRICVSKALMRMRRNDRFLEADASHEGRHEFFGGRRDLETALAQISATTRVVLWLHDVEGYTHEEIAAKLDCVPRTIERKVRRIRMLWKDELKGLAQ